MKAILSVDDGKAYLQNADTNAYLEGKFAAVDQQISNAIGGAIGGSY